MYRNIMQHRNCVARQNLYIRTSTWQYHGHACIHRIITFQLAFGCLLVCTDTFPAKEFPAVRNLPSSLVTPGHRQVLVTSPIASPSAMPQLFVLAMWSPSERWDNLYILWMTSLDFNPPEIILKVVGSCFNPQIRFGNSDYPDVGGFWKKRNCCFEQIVVEV